MKYNDPQNRGIIGGVRCCGKTTELIKMAARFGCLIICASPARAKCVEYQAREMGLFIEPPKDICSVLAKPESMRGRDVTILVDDVEAVLETALRQRVVVMSTSANLEPMECLKEDTEE